MYSQTTFTATNVKVMDTLINYNVIRAEALTTNYTLRAKDHVVLEQNLEVHGDISLSGNLGAVPSSTTSLGDLKVSGNTILNSNLKIGGLAGTANRLTYVDGSGNLRTIGAGTDVDPNTGGPCQTNAVPWYVGGNYLSVISGYPQNIGTCDANDFVLKANNLQSIWVKPDGKVGVGTSSPTEKFEVFGYGKFGGGAGNIRIGHDNANAIIDNFGAGSFLVNAYSGGDVELCTGTWLPGGGGKVRVGKFLSAMQHVEIGDPTWGIAANNSPANNVALEMHVNSGKAIKVRTYDGSVSMFEVFNYGANVNTTTFKVDGNGKTNIGGAMNTTTSYMLTVNGRIGAREIKVSMQDPWPDYVFSKNYRLQSLDAVEKFITVNKHLPNIPSAEELSKEELGLNLGEMQAKQMEKIEEIFLYLFEVKKELEQLKKENEALKKRIKSN